MKSKNKKIKYNNIDVGNTVNTIAEPRTKKSKPLYNRLIIPMILLSLVQMITFLGALIISGEFDYIKQYAYNMFIEKTENRKSYVENMLVSKINSVTEAAQDINITVAKVLKDTGLSITDVSQDKSLNKEIISRCSDRLVELMRSASVNDAYIVLDSGDLYNKDGSIKKSGFYIRDLDVTTGNKQDKSDLLIELGSADIANAMGITLDSQWSSHLTLSALTGKKSDFYYGTLDAARKYSDIPAGFLGHWSDFSSITSTGQPSMKYSIPLVYDDGTVYGIVGIGLMEKTILSAIPSNDFFNKSACYILCCDDNHDGIYDPVIHSGAMYRRLVDEKTKISTTNKIAPGVYNFNVESSTDAIGCLSQMKLYSNGSPYLKENWALVSMASESDILSIYNTIIFTLLISTAISAIICLILSIFISRIITDPVKKIAALMDEKMDEGSIISFKPSGVSEIDTLSSSISELQVTVREQASRVSKIISMADVGLGVFMYDPRNHTVFVGESFIKLIDSKLLPKEDMMLSREKFYELLQYIDETALFTIRRFTDDVAEYTDDEEMVEFYSQQLNKWLRCKVLSAENKIIGLFLDITAAVAEKKKIEFERDHDVTTGLLNRRAYFNCVHELFNEPEKLGVAAFVMMDLDNLKYVNDTYGHDFGDIYIQTAADILKQFNEHNGLVARLSGDEFNVFLYGFGSQDQVRKVIKSVWNKMNESSCVLADGSKFRVRASAGISWYPDDSENYELLVKYADFAMYTVKHSTKGMIAEFDLNTYNKDSILITGLEEMNRIIDEQSVQYAFQPIISAKDGSVYGYEALMRPVSDVFRSPLDFIRIAKTAAKLHEVERLTWYNALKSFRVLLDNGKADDSTKVFINSLPDCRMKPGDITQIENEYSDILSRIVMETLEGEQTNEVFMKGKQKNMAHWHAMTALDDFGCGYNSEYALITLSPDLIKIDRSIISGCDTDIGRRNIICNLISHARLRNILVLAEGVETREEMQTVIECGVDLLQGYYINRPQLDPQPVPDNILEEIREFNLAKQENETSSDSEDNTDSNSDNADSNSDNAESNSDNADSNSDNTGNNSDNTGNSTGSDNAAGSDDNGDFDYDNSHSSDYYSDND